METKKKWYQSNGGVIALLILFFPIGLYLMWKYTNWNKTIKLVVTGVFAFLIFANATGGSKSTSDNQNTTPTAVPTQQITYTESQTQEPTIAPTKATNSPATNSNETVSQKNAVRKAKSYLAYSAFSHDGLVAQLEYEKFSHEDAVYGADNSGGNWNEQAAKKAKSYMDISGYSRDGLIAQLKYEKFTQEQAEYGANTVGL